MYGSQQRGEDWTRALVVESAGLAFSAFAGLGIALVLKPFGWVILLLAAGSAAVLADHFGKYVGALA